MLTMALPAIRHFSSKANKESHHHPLEKKNLSWVVLFEDCPANTTGTVRSSISQFGTISSPIGERLWSARGPTRPPPCLSWPYLFSRRSGCVATASPFFAPFSLTPGLMPLSLPCSHAVSTAALTRCATGCQPWCWPSAKDKRAQGSPQHVESGDRISKY